jgi:hypothetical protein
MTGSRCSTVPTVVVDGHSPESILEPCHIRLVSLYSSHLRLASALGRYLSIDRHQLAPN